VKRVKAAVCASVLLLASKGYGQTTLTQVFLDLHSSNASVRASANKAIVEVFEREIPNISADTALLCTSLTDNDAYIRQQASGILSVLVQLHPEDVAVVSSCTAQLIKTGADQIDQVRQNSLFVLANKANGAPASAAPDFEAALTDSVPVMKELGASGIFSLPSDSSSGSMKLLVDRLSNEQDPVSKEALLLGVTQSKKTNGDVAQAAAWLIGDSDSRVQAAAVLAVESVNSDKNHALSQLQNYEGSTTLSSEAKQKVSAAILRLQAKVGQPN
jgi:hypothetical protein